MRGRLHDLTLRARWLLSDETRDLLEGIYGLHQNGSLEEPATLPAIQSLEEARETRAHLEQLLADERDAGLKIAEAVEKLVRETAFTWLNRLAALKMLEARGLVRQSLLKGSDSNSFKLWLTTPGNEADLRRYEAGSLPLDALGEGHAIPPIAITCCIFVPIWQLRFAFSSILILCLAGFAHVPELWRTCWPC